MLVIECIKLALSSIRVNKMRSFLTMLGIIIGISSVIAITSIGSSMQAVVNKQFESIGKGATYVAPDWRAFPDYIPNEVFFNPDDLENVMAKFSDSIDYAELSCGTTSDVTIGRKKAQI